MRRVLTIVGTPSNTFCVTNWWCGAGSGWTPGPAAAIRRRAIPQHLLCAPGSLVWVVYDSSARGMAGNRRLTYGPVADQLGRLHAAL